MDTRTFEMLMESIFFEDVIDKISDTVCVVENGYDPGDSFHGVCSVDSTVAGLDKYAAADNSYADKVFAQAIAAKDYARLIELVDAESDKDYLEREAMQLAAYIGEVSANDFGLPGSNSDGVSEEDLAYYMEKYGDA